MIKFDSMTKARYTLTLCFFLLFVGNLLGQKQDSIRAEYLLPFGGGFQVTGAQLASRYGTFLDLNLGFKFKNTKGWTFGLNFDYLFESRIKDSTIFSQLENEFGQITGTSGVPVPVRFSGIGAKLDLEIGKIIPITTRNKNGGLWITGRIGYLQHKIRMFGELDNLPQLSGEYRKGYDRLSHALNYSAFIGYLYLPPLIRSKISEIPTYDNIFGLYAGIEISSGWAYSLRSYNFSSMSATSHPQLGRMLGFKIGWIFTMEHRKKNGDHYY